MQRMVGNAVPSLVAEVLAREIRRQLLDSPLEKPLQLKPPHRISVPLPESIPPLPGKYLPQAGNYATHPGTGQGQAAIWWIREREAAREEA